MANANRGSTGRRERVHAGLLGCALLVVSLIVGGVVYVVVNWRTVVVTIANHSGSEARGIRISVSASGGSRSFTFPRLHDGGRKTVRAQGHGDGGASITCVSEDGRTHFQAGEYVTDGMHIRFTLKPNGQVDVTPDIPLIP